MPGSTVLGTAVGLVALFGATAVLCSGLVEALSNLLQLRAKYLLTGLRAMLDSPQPTLTPAPSAAAWPRSTALGRADGDPSTAAGPSGPGLGTKVRAAVRATDPVHDAVKQPGEVHVAAGEVRTWDPDSRPSDPAVVTKALFDSPLISSLQSRRVWPGGRGSTRNPQYISGQAFARALVDLLVPTDGSDPDAQAPLAVDTDRIRAAVESLPAQLPLRRQLLAFLGTAGADVDAFMRALEQWYDEQMATISGWYKRWSRVALGIVGFAVAVAANIDTLHVAHVLTVDVPVQQAVVTATANAGSLCPATTDPDARARCALAELTALEAGGVPVGWPDASVRSVGDLALKLLGWVITAFAVSFGAPFWFDALSKLGSLRNTGPRPGDT
jgi:hypothetical protein